MAYFKVLSWDLSEGTEEEQKSMVRIDTGWDSHVWARCVSRLFILVGIVEIQNE
jgi:hypothetical protein